MCEQEQVSDQDVIATTLKQSEDVSIDAEKGLLSVEHVGTQEISLIWVHHESIVQIDVATLDYR